MTALELRLVCYGLLALIVIGGSAYFGHWVTARHYTAIIAADKAAQDLALQDAKDKVIAAQQAQATASQQAEKAHETLVAADTTARNALLGRVRDLETALHLGAVSSTVDHPGQPSSTSAGTGSASEIARSVDRLNDAIAGATAACQHDSAELAAILSLEPR